MKSKNKITRTFNLPKPILIGGGNQKFRNLVLNEKKFKIASIGKRNFNNKGSKQKLARPYLIQHECLSECNCKVCKEHINSLDVWRKNL